MPNAPVLHYEGVNGVTWTYADSLAKWNSIRDYHLGQGYSDIAYNFGTGNDDGPWLIGRGWDTNSAANGIDQWGNNRNPGSRVMCWLGGPDDPLSPAAKFKMVQFRDQAWARGYSPGWITDHQGLGVQTSCAGPVRDWIAAGMPLEDDMSQQAEQDIADIKRWLSEGIPELNVPGLMKMSLDVHSVVVSGFTYLGVQFPPLYERIAAKIDSAGGGGGGPSLDAIKAACDEAVVEALNATRLVVS